MSTEWIRAIADAAHFETGKYHAIVELAQGYRIPRGSYAKRITANQQRTRIAKKEPQANLYVVSNYPEGRVVWANRFTVLWDEAKS